MALGKQVKRYRERLNLTLEALSDRSGVDIGTISALENRDSRRSEKSSALARGLGLTLDQLLDESRDWSDQSGQAAGVGEPVKVQEPAAQYRQEWPFDDVTKTQWNALDDKERGLVEGFLLGLLKAKRVERKSPKTGTRG